jgi:hypothetical protein
MRDRPTDRHRTLTERELGRTLGPNEVVDHVDTDKANNTPANRRVMSRSAHSKSHATPARRAHAKLVKALTMVRDGRKDY